MKKKLLILLTLIFMTPFVIKAEELQMECQKSWGGNKSESLNNVIETEDGNFILVGNSTSTDIEGLPNKGDQDVIILKYDKDGNMIWQKSWGGNDFDVLNNAIETEDGSIILVGSSYSTDIEGLTNKGRQDAIIIKYDKNGNMLWQKSWGGNNNDFLNNVIETEDGNIILFGRSGSTDIEGLPNKGSTDITILKYDKDGNMLWQKSWGGNGGDILNNVLETEDGNFILFGSSSSTDIEGLPNKGSDDAVIVKYDKDGNMIWQKSWGGNDIDSLNNVIETEDGSIILVGTSPSIDIEGLPNKGRNDAVIVKYDKDGNMLWQKSWGGNDIDSLNNVIEIEDGNFILFGNSYSTDIEGLPNKGSRDIILVKYSIEYDLGNVEAENGSAELKQEGKYGIITPIPNEGYEVDKIIIKDIDGNILDIETTKREDGTYSFELYTDVSVEVLFKEKIENPKTGILDVITIIFVGLVLSLSGFFLVKNYNERLEF